MNNNEILGQSLHQELIETDQENGVQPTFIAENVGTKYETRINTPAVLVEGAFKKYGRGPPVLNNFSMTVRRGTIYGLLGSSGCGKTTILSCIVGLKKLDRGNISVFGAIPGTKESGIPGRTVGYMPQDIALYQIFTIKEILQYFGRIYGMTKTEVLSRMQFLLNFLDLPDCNRRIDSLSGGQQRRVSLSLAMIHTPELLILDEPTVGVDPLLRESIWEYLCDMVSKRGTTVIVTTHYIEESRQANHVGLMRNGRLLTEKPPLELLKEHNTTLLEDIVLKLCKKDSLKFVDSNESDEVKKALAETSFYSRKKGFGSSNRLQRPVVGLTYKSRSPDDLTLCRPLKSQFDRRRRSIVQNAAHDFSSHVDKVLALTIKNLKTLIRYPLFFVVFLLIPAQQVVLYNFIMGADPKDIQIGVVNHEFESTDYLNSCKQRVPGCFKDAMSCNFLNSFSEEDFSWIPFSSEEDALEAVQRGKTLGYISIPSNFTEHLKDRSLMKNYVDNETMDGSDIGIRIDMSYSIKAAFTRTKLYMAYLQFIKNMVSDCGGDPRSVELPMKYTPIYGDLEGGQLEFMQPAQILLIIFLLPMASSVTFVWDKRAGTLDRTMVAGVEFYHIMTAFVLSEGLMIIMELALCLSVLKLAFDFTIQGSIFLAFLLCLLQGITGLSFGFLFGTLWEYEIEVVLSIIAFYLPCMTSSAGTWPLESVHRFLRPICDLLPATLSIEAIRSIISRGWGLEHSQVYLGFVSLISWTALCCFLSGFIHRMKK